MGGGGGYALAATRAKTITVCADKRTGILHLHTRGRCKRGQRKITWNQQGPQGVQGVRGQTGPQGGQGAQGATGPQGAPAVSVWANVSDQGSVIAGQGIEVQHVAAGTYQITITDSTCARRSNAPVVTVSDSNPPAGHVAGALPAAWYQDAGPNQQFTVFTGVVAGGTFSASDHTFDLHDACV
jgi:hypothetical protein